MSLDPNIDNEYDLMFFIFIILNIFSIILKYWIINNQNVLVFPTGSIFSREHKYGIYKIAKEYDFAEICITSKANIIFDDGIISIKEPLISDDLSEIKTWLFSPRKNTILHPDFFF